jgi:hypothetical protein
MENNKRYEKRNMHMVTVIKATADGHTATTAMFEDKEDAGKYRDMMNAEGHSAVLNRWTWEVHIEA